MRVPFKKTYYDGREAESARDALLCGADYIGRVKGELQKVYEDSTLFLTSSASAAFELLFGALMFERGGEVIMPSFTYPSAANTVLRYGLKPVFAEIDESTMALDLKDVERKLTDKTVCVIPTHYGGSSTDLDELKRICGNVTVIEDAALSFGAEYKNKPLGSIGDFGIISFHKTKNVSAEQGGLLIVNGEDEDVIKMLQTVYDNGTDRQAFFDGKVDAYSWQTVGQNPAMPNINAAVLSAQLNKADEIRTEQRKVCEYYRDRLSGRDGVKLPEIPEHNVDNYHVFYLLLECNETREAVRIALAEKGIGAYFHYTPLHASSIGIRLGYKPEDLPVTLSVSERLLRLPVYAGMTEEQHQYVAECILEALG